MAICRVSRTWDDGHTDTYDAPWPDYTPEDAYRRRINSLREWWSGRITADKAALTITVHSDAWAYDETLTFLRCSGDEEDPDA